MIEILKLLKLPPGVAGSLKFPATRGPPSACFAHRFTQDRVTLDGQLQPGGLQTPSNLGNINPSAPGTTYIIGNPIPGRSTTPPAPPLSRPDLERLADFIAASKSGVLVITGAGCSTESNVPDYRSPGGAYSTGFKPMTHQAFMASAENRSRYWARSFAGWLRFSKVQPNAAHEGIARLQQVGWVSDVVTQNVDRLHHKAGSSAVLELHGTTHEVVCMSCCATYAREEVQAWMEELNPEAAEAAAALAAAANEADEMERLLKAGTAAPVAPSLRERPDGDVELPRQRPDGDAEVTIPTASFQVPPCPSCGGILKPDVVFFGDSLPPERAQRSLELARQAPAVLVVGSSLAVWSAFRLVKTAKEKGATVAIVNVGPTRGDELADLAVSALAGETMIQLAAHPTLLINPADY